MGDAKPVPVEIVPVTGLRDAIRWREALAEAIANLIKDYEKRVPHARVEALQISRTEVSNHIGTKRSKLAVVVRVVLTE